MHFISKQKSESTRTLYLKVLTTILRASIESTRAEVAASPITVTDAYTLSIDPAM